ncbi:MAG: hypothetical protein FJW29_05635 [Acidobacteria bacterium]|nr:hypothetical protein [Acidobacteriota bacterium]
MQTTRIASRSVWAGLAFAVLVGGTGACAREDPYEGADAYREQQVVLEREVQGLRDIISRLDAGDALLPASDIIVAVDDTFVQELLSAELPLEIAVESFRISLTGVKVAFAGAPLVELRGHVVREGVVAVEGDVRVIGALSELVIYTESSMLRASVAVDHIAIDRVSGLDAFVSGSTLDEVARTIRLQMASRLPTLKIPIAVQQSVSVPGLTEGPVTISPARLPLNASISRTLAGRGRLWVALHVEVGVVEKQQGAAPVRGVVDLSRKRKAR